MLPVIGISVEVHDRYDDDFIGTFPEKDAKGKCLGETSADIKLHDGVKTRIDNDTVDCVLNGRQESLAEIGLLRFVICSRFGHLDFRIGVEPDFFHVNEE